MKLGALVGSVFCVRVLRERHGTRPSSCQCIRMISLLGIQTSICRIVSVVSTHLAVVLFFDDAHVECSDFSWETAVCLVVRALTGGAVARRGLIPVYAHRLSRVCLGLVGALLGRLGAFARAVRRAGVRLPGRKGQRVALGNCCASHTHTHCQPTIVD